MLENFTNNNKTSDGFYASVVCNNDEGTYEGVVVAELPHGIWFSVGGNEDRLVFFPWSSINRVVLKKF